MGFVTKDELYQAGLERMVEFCAVNEIKRPSVVRVIADEWPFDECAYYRLDEGINICLQKCANRTSENQLRNWNWPGNTTDRTPYGVLAHELGHHCDMLKSDKKGHYFGDYSKKLREGSGEKEISGYCPNFGEWFAEMFRVFVTNPLLLSMIRPKTYELLCEDWLPVNQVEWTEALLGKPPQRIIDNLRKKGAE